MNSNACLTQKNVKALIECAQRMGVTPELALEMAIARFRIDVMQLAEGDLADVDFSQSLRDEDIVPQAGARTFSLQGFERD